MRLGLVYLSGLLMTGMLAGCSSKPPPAYRLDGDACSVVPVDYFQNLTVDTPTTEPSELKNGMAGGNCALEFDGTNGYIKLSVFMVIHSDGTAAKAMFDDFRASDEKRTSGTGAIGD